MPLILAAFVFVGMPIIELAVLIVVGGRIGVLPTLGLVVASAVLGAVLLRRQGFAALGRMKADARAGRVPGRDMVHAVMIVVAGILLVLPGLIGDAIGLLLFLPPVRDVLWRALGRSVTVVVSTPRGTYRRPGPGLDAGSRRPPVVELSEADFRRQDEAGPGFANGDDRRDPPNRPLH